VPKRRAFGIDTAALTCDRHDFRMLPQYTPGSCPRRDQNRSILLALPPCPIVDAHATQNRIVAGHDGQPIKESLAQTSPYPATDQSYNFRSAISLTSVNTRDAAAAHRKSCGGTTNSNSETGRPSPIAG